MPVTLTARTAALRRSSERFRRVLLPPGSGESDTTTVHSGHWRAVRTPACCVRYRPTGSGTVLLFAAEDAAHRVRKRLHGIAHAAATPFDELDIAVIDVPTFSDYSMVVMRRLVDSRER